jgi:hypothetical protein
MVYVWGISSKDKIYMVIRYWYYSPSCWLPFSKSSHIWNIGQKVAHILETLPQEETVTAGKLDLSCKQVIRQTRYLRSLLDGRLKYKNDKHAGPPRGVGRPEGGG